MKALTNGVWSGVFATSAMTLGLMTIFKRLPKKEQSPLPPGTLTSQITSTVGLDQQLDSSERQNAALVSHYGYGSAFSLLYAFLPARLKKNTLAAGAGYGMLIWGMSYLGLTPSLGLRARAANMPASRNGMMIATHLIWGVTLAFSERWLREDGAHLLDGHLKAPAAE